MPVTFRLRDIPPALELRLREAAESAIEGEWCVTVSRSHLDGQWYLQLDGASQRCRAVLAAPTGSVRQLELMLRRLCDLCSSATVRSEAGDTTIRQAS